MVEPSRGESARALVGVDVGGTFTDAVVVHAGGVATAKVPTTPDDHSDGVMRAIGVALAAADISASEVTRLAHGMTVGTNALLERRGARTVLVTTMGIEDVLELRRQDRASLYRLDVAHPEPLVAADSVVGVNERVGARGVVSPLTQTAIRESVARVTALAPEAVAVGLLFSYAHPDHERRLGDAIRTALPGVHVSTSSDVLAEVREYERIATTVLNAYLSPLLATYLDRLGRRAQDRGLPHPMIMQSNGGVIPLDDAAAYASRTVLSGPAGGVMGAALIARAEGAAVALAFDMGGTSCDVSLIMGGEPGRAPGQTVAGHSVALPMLDIETVSAGGGSIAWADAGGALRVGPRSAGAVPGPAAYGRGGTLPTVTDANVVLGRLTGDLGIGGTIPMDANRARDAVAALAATLGLAVDQCAEGIVRVAVSEMAAALRVVSVERGIDPRPGTLIAYGGAGPLHACAVAEDLGISRITCPATAGVLAALGMVTAGERRDYVQSVLLPVESGSALTDAVAPLIDRARAEIPTGHVEVSADCRYSGQSHPITVPWDPRRPEADLRAAFHCAHAQQSGLAMPDRAIEAVSVRVAVSEDGPTMPPPGMGTPRESITGPAGLPMAGSFCWVADGWIAAVADDGAVRMTRT